MNTILCYNYKRTDKREWVNSDINKFEYFIKPNIDKYIQTSKFRLYFAMWGGLTCIIDDWWSITMQMPRKYPFIVN